MSVELFCGILEFSTFKKGFCEFASSGGSKSLKSRLKSVGFLGVLLLDKGCSFLDIIGVAGTADPFTELIGGSKSRYGFLMAGVG